MIMIRLFLDLKIYMLMLPAWYPYKMARFFQVKFLKFGLGIENNTFVLAFFKPKFDGLKI